MDPNLKANLKSQLEAALSEYQQLVQKSKYDDLSDLRGHDHQRATALMRAAVHRVGGSNSTYAQQVEHILGRVSGDGYKVTELAGIIDALLADFNAGYLQSVEELIHGELFSDFLEMSIHLLEEGYKDPSAVVTGSALEAHLRQLCKRHSIDVEVIVGGKPRPKKADQMNADLKRANVYSMLDQKNVTAWLDLRNKAAHGLYAEYTADQVRLMTDGVRDFITRNPA